MLWEEVLFVKNKRTLITSLLLLLISLVCIVSVFAHSGRTDSNGGHWDRQSGTYHFHTGEYAGKSSSESSSNSEYVPFKPPYEPPTDNPYRNDKEIGEVSDTGLDIKKILKNIFEVVICILLIGMFVYVDFANSDGCLTFGISASLIAYLIIYLITEKPFWFFILILITVILVYLIIKLKNKISNK